eukprot:s218_g37.t1
MTGMASCSLTAQLGHHSFGSQNPTKRTTRTQLERNENSHRMPYPNKICVTGSCESNSLYQESTFFPRLQNNTKHVHILN